MDVKIVHVDEFTRKVSIRLSSETVEGVDALVQIVVLSLLNKSGKSVLDPEDGAGLPDLIGTNLSAEDPQELFAEVQQMINKTKAEVTAQQVGLDLDAEEKLKSLTILSIEPGAQEDEVFVKVRLINEAGRITDLAV